MFVPKACSAVLVRRTADLAAVFSHEEDYIPHEDDELNAVDVTLEYSRPLRALKLWLTFKTHGRDQIAAAVQADGLTVDRDGGAHGRADHAERAGGRRHGGEVDRDDALLPRHDGDRLLRALEARGSDLDDVIARRRAAWKRPAPRYTRGLMAKYMKLVGPATRGAVTDHD
mgnify:CR=1 FL=1